MKINKKKEIEFFFDCSSPWTYLAFKEIVPLCSRNSCSLIWKPILVGGIFNSTNPSVYETRKNPVKEKFVYSQKDLQDWANIRNVTINWPDIFPVNSVKAMRGVFYALTLEDEFGKEFSENLNYSGELYRYVEAVFHAYWEDNLDISSEKVLGNIVDSLGWKKEKFLFFIQEPSTKDRLRLNTQELINRGGFGSPTIFLDKTNMFFGNDRLDLIDKLLKMNC